MAFVLNVTLDNMEYRHILTGVSSQSGKPWMSLVFEDKEANQIQASVPNDMQGDVYGLGLRKGDMCVIAVRAVARNDGNSYVQLTALPEIYEGEDE